MINFTECSLDELKKRGFMRWGRDPIPNLWLMPAECAPEVASGQVLYGIDGNKYVVGVDHIDGTLLFGYLAYGIKVDADVAPGLPEVSSAALTNALSCRRERRRAERQAAKDRGVFLQ